MDFLDLVIIVSGTFLVLLVLLDVFLAVLHIDISGIIAPRIFRFIWRSAIFLSSALPRLRRQILALAGPVMMVSIFLIWIGLFILGFSLIYWRNLPSYRGEAELGPLGFIDALYYSGITGTVLGYGDISPLTGAMKACAFIQSGLGFALLTGIVAYLLSVSGGVTQRNSLALFLSAATQGGEGGIRFLTRSLESTGADLFERLFFLCHSLQGLHERMHQFPILDLFYRSLDRLRDPEPMLLALTEIAIGAQLLTLSPTHRRLRPVAEELGWTIENTMKLFARQYMGRDLLEQLENPKPETVDRDYLEEIRNRLDAHLAQPLSALDGAQSALLLACRRRVFFTDLARFTGWQRDSEELGSG